MENFYGNNSVTIPGKNNMALGKMERKIKDDKQIKIIAVQAVTPK